MVTAAAQGAGIVPMAFVGRTSTDNMQDPVESLSRQLRVARSRLPEGFAITRYYWDVESGATDLDQRSRTSAWQRFTNAGIPRDGGMAELRAEIRTGRPAFAAVICENIERTGRDNYDALRLEKELHAAGIMIFAADEPFDAQAPEGSTILVRRVKQGIAEYFRYNLKAQMWEGLKQYVISGFNTGPCPYGYAEERTVHPNPIKASMGATRARLVPDPERAGWVTQIFEWRVDLKLSAEAIAQRLHQQAAPSKDGRPWTVGAVHSILRNPKYTGKVVIGRTRNAGKGKRAGERKMRPVPREHWTWAADDNAHAPLISMEVWESRPGHRPRARQRSRPPGPGQERPRRLPAARPHPLPPVQPAHVRPSAARTSARQGVLLLLRLPAQPQQPPRRPRPSGTCPGRRQGTGDPRRRGRNHQPAAIG